MVLNLINKMDNKEYNITKKMLSSIREAKNNSSKISSEGLNENITLNKKPSMLQEHKDLLEKLKKKSLNESDTSKESDNKFKITKSTPQFGDVRVSQEETLKKTIGEDIEMGDDGLVYYSNNKDLVLTAKIDSLNIVFQFKYRDQSGDGCYLWANGLQLTESNERTIGKIRDAFKNWKDNLIQDSDLLEKLHKSATE